MATRLVADDFVTNLADLFDFGNDMMAYIDKYGGYTRPTDRRAETAVEVCRNA